MKLGKNFRKAKKLLGLEKSDMEYRLITVEKPESTPSEAYRRIKVGLDFSEVDTPLKVIQVCSALQGEGKTLTLLNLARTYVEDGRKVIFVDCDLRRPKAHRSMKIKNENGLVDVLTGKVELDKAIKKHEAGFDVLNSGSKAPYPTSIIGSEALKELINKLRDIYDIVLVDCPPILAVSDAVLISKWTDGCLFVASAKVARKPSTKEAISILKSNGVKILGSVFTEVGKGSADYYTNKYYYQSNYAEESK